VKLRKRAATVPFFTPIIALLLCLIISIIGLAYNLWKINSQEDPEPETKQTTIVDVSEYDKNI
jgi:hypothetical protein